MKKLLIVKPGSLGDIIHALPVAAAIRRSRPGARIVWLADARWAPLVAAVPAVDELAPFPREKFRGIQGWFAAAKWAAGLRALRPEMALDLQGLLRSALMGRAARPRLLLGLSDAREGARFLFDRAARVGEREHSVERYLRILELLDIPRPESPEFPLPEGARPAGLPPAPFLAVAPYARGPGKSLPLPVLEAVCRHLAPHPVVLLGPPGPAPESPHVHNLLGRTSLLELVGALREAAGVLSVDSAAAHLAAALGRPLVAIHTWSDPKKVGPYSPAAGVWRSGTIGRFDSMPDAPARLPTVEDAPALAAGLLSRAAL